MALETLQGKTFPYVSIDHNTNTIAFTIQKGPVKENGVNGCQVDNMIHVASVIIEELNAQFPCEENEQCLHYLTAALDELTSRRVNRETRGVEGYDKI